MSTEVAKPQNFEQRVFDRMRQNIGELMTDEEMKKLLETALQKMFFTTKVIDNGYGYNNRREEPPQIYAIVKELLEPQLRKCLSEYLAANGETVTKAIDQALAEGFTQALAKSLNHMMSQPMVELQSQLMNVMSVNNLRSS